MSADSFQSFSRGLQLRVSRQLPSRVRTKYQSGAVRSSALWLRPLSVKSERGEPKWRVRDAGLHAGIRGKSVYRQRTHHSTTKGGVWAVSSNRTRTYVVRPPNQRSAIAYKMRYRDHILQPSPVFCDCPFRVCRRGSFLASEDAYEYVLHLLPRGELQGKTLKERSCL